MQRRAFKPCPVARIKVEINDGSKTEGEIGAWNLPTILSPKVWMGVDRVVIQRGGVTRMHVGVDQARNQKSSAAVYPLGMRTGNQVCADFGDPAIAENNISMKQRSGAFRRDQTDIFDYDVLISNALSVRTGSNI
jgi:hypothetical protein